MRRGLIVRGFVEAIGLGVLALDLLEVPRWLELGVWVWFLTHWGYLAALLVVQMQAAGRLTRYWEEQAAPLLVGFYFLDAAFNATYGSLSFLELPRWLSGEFLFSSRVQRHVDTSDGWRLRRALEWSGRLNAPDRTHIRPRDG